MTFARKNFIALSMLLSYFQPLHATIPPESLNSMQPAKTAEIVDPNLEKWIEMYVSPPNPIDQNKQYFLDFIRSKDDITKALLFLRYANSKLSASSIKSDALSYALKKVNEIKDSQDKGGSLHKNLVIPYLLEEILLVKSLKDREREWVTTTLREVGTNSCPMKELIIRDLDDERATHIDDKRARQFMQNIAKFNSPTFQQEALEELLQILPIEYQNSIAKEMLPLVKPYPKILEDNLWLPR